MKNETLRAVQDKIQTLSRFLYHLDRRFLDNSLGSNLDLFPMRLVIFSDASFCHQTKAAGWGSWSSRDDWEQGKKNGGVIFHDIDNVGSAEIWGIASAILYHRKKGHLKGVTEILLQCDNAEALTLIKANVARCIFLASGEKQDLQSLNSNKKQKPKNPIDSVAIAAIKKACLGRTLMLCHVRGHSEGSERHFINNLCDTEAKKRMLDERNRRNRIAI